MNDKNKFSVILKAINILFIFSFFIEIIMNKIIYKPFFFFFFFFFFVKIYCTTLNKNK